MPIQDLMRFSVAMPEELLIQFDALVARRGLAKNRSEVMRDLVRDALTEESCAIPGMEVAGTLTFVYDMQVNDLPEKMLTIQQDYSDNIVSSTRVQLNDTRCLEVIILRGETGVVQEVGNMLLGLKGVKNGKLVLTTIGYL